MLALGHTTHKHIIVLLSTYNLLSKTCANVDPAADIQNQCVNTFFDILLY